jgi:hypothetical protein
VAAAKGCELLELATRRFMQSSNSLVTVLQKAVRVRYSDPVREAVTVSVDVNLSQKK